METIAVPKSLLHRIADADDPNPPEHQLTEIREALNLLLDADALGEPGYRVRRVAALLDDGKQHDAIGRVFDRSTYWVENIADIARACHANHA